MPDLPNTPQSNVEEYLAVQAGMEGNTPAIPGSRVEQYLAKILENHYDIPTKTSDLINDSGFQTLEEVTAAIRAELAGIVQVEWRVVQALPSFGEMGVIYLVPNSGTGTNVHDEYLWISTTSSFEKIGTTDVDLTGYVKKTQKVGGVALTGDVPVSMTGDTAISITNTGTASAIGYSVTHNDSGVTAGSKGDTTAQTPAFGGTFKTLSATVDAKGHVVALSEHNVTVPSATATSSANGLMSSDDKAKLDGIPGGIDAIKLAFQFALPNNVLIADDTGNLGAYVERPAMKVNQLINTTEAAIHPAFLYRDGSVVKDSIFIAKYLASASNNRAYSLPRKDPRANIDFDASLLYCRNKGNGHHPITFAEWAYLALLAKKRGTMPKGNNDYGKDASESLYLAIPSYKDGNGTTCRTAAGTGPLTWSDTGDATGIMDLNGDVWEWNAGMRLVYGELQFIPYNNAADPTVDMSATSTAWKAIKATATSYNDLYITPNGAGTTSGSVKLDYVSGHWQWAASVASVENSVRNAQFKLTTSSGLSAFCKMYLQAMALLPEDGDSNYGDDNMWANNGAAERLPFRGGTWYNGVEAGVFALNLNNPRSTSAWDVGFRAAFVNL